MKILYVGPDRGTSRQRVDALRRLNIDTLHLPIHSDLPNKWFHWLIHAGGLGLDIIAARALNERLSGLKFDAAITDNGDVIGPRAMKVLRAHAARVINYNADNPFLKPSPEKYRWRILTRSLPLYDVCVTIKRPGIEDTMRAAGVRNPLPVWQAADEITHRPVANLDPTWDSDVVFVGTWMPGRDEFMAKLLDLGVPLSIYGPRWTKSPAYERIRHALRGSYLEGDDYTAAIAGAKVALVLLNHRNSDLHTNRSVEIPAIGSAMCLEDTEYHRALYENGTEAMMFRSAEECAKICLDLLSDDTRRRALAAAGHARAIRNGTYNEVLMKHILEHAGMER